MGEPERFVVSQIVIPADIVDDKAALEMMWDLLRQKAATAITAERPGWVLVDGDERRTTQFLKFVGEDGNAAELPCDREEAGGVGFMLVVWAEPSLPDQ